MADSVSSLTLFNGKRKLVMKFLDVSDATGETNVVKVDKSAFTGIDGTEPSKIVIEKIKYDIQGMSVRVIYDFDTDETVAVLTSDGLMDFTEIGGLKTSGSGGTGDIMFTTVGAQNNDTYDITLYMRKDD